MEQWLHLVVGKNSEEPRERGGFAFLFLPSDDHIDVITSLLQ